MRLGLIGPANGDLAALARTAEFLLNGARVTRAIYLGDDDALEETVGLWAESLVGDDPSDAGVWDRAFEVAATGTPERIDAFLRGERARLRLRDLERLSPEELRSVEMFGDRVAVLIHDKAMLDEEDIFSASFLIYGKSDSPLVKPDRPPLVLDARPRQRPRQRRHRARRLGRSHRRHALRRRRHRHPDRGARGRTRGEDERAGVTRVSLTLVVKVAVFGGSFNPPHVAHVLACALVLAVEDVERVLVVPTFLHPFAKPLAPYEDRVAMCRLAFSSLPQVEVSRVEQQLGGESRTLRTLEHLAAAHDGWELRLIVGADILAEAPTLVRVRRHREARAAHRTRARRRGRAGRRAGAAARGVEHARARGHRGGAPGSKRVASFRGPCWPTSRREVCMPRRSERPRWTCSCSARASWGRPWRAR